MQRSATHLPPPWSKTATFFDHRPDAHSLQLATFAGFEQIVDDSRTISRLRRSRRDKLSYWLSMPGNRKGFAPLYPIEQFAQMRLCFECAYGFHRSAFQTSL
jgi:hypothetical protein